MEPVLISNYRLGIRLRQAILTYRWASGSRTRVTASSVTAVKQALGRLSAAFQRWSQCVEAGQVEKQGDQLLEKAIQEWDAVCQRPNGSRANSTLDAHLEQIEALCREFVSSRRHFQLENEHWFNLGLEIVQAEETQNRAPHRKGQKAPVLKRRWTWKNVKKVAGLLRELQVSEDRLLSNTEQAEDSLGDGVPEHWLKDQRTTSWPFIEAGLQNLMAALPPHRRKPRKMYDRDHQFLKWYNDESLETYHSPAKIRDRWNQLHPKEPVTIDVVKTGIRKAKVESRQAR